MMAIARICNLFNCNETRISICFEMKQREHSRFSEGSREIRKDQNKCKVKGVENERGIVVHISATERESKNEENSGTEKQTQKTTSEAQHGRANHHESAGSACDNR